MARRTRIEGRLLLGKAETIHRRTDASIWFASLPTYRYYLS